MNQTLTVQLETIRGGIKFHADLPFNIIPLPSEFLEMEPVPDVVAVNAGEAIRDALFPFPVWSIQGPEPLYLFAWRRTPNPVRICNLRIVTYPVDTI